MKIALASWCLQVGHCAAVIDNPSQSELRKGSGWVNFVALRDSGDVLPSSMLAAATFALINCATSGTSNTTVNLSHLGHFPNTNYIKGELA